MKNFVVSPSAPRHKSRTLCVLAFLLVVAPGCDGDSVAPDPSHNLTNNLIISSVSVYPNVKLAGSPHRFDVYRPTKVADKAVVFLHGGGGTKEYLAYQLGLKLDPGTTDYRVANARVLVDHRAIAVFPQGQAIPGAPRVYTWDNYVMGSGQDDMKFIRNLAGYLVAQYGVSELYIVGHSNGGMMVSRIWCEAPELLDGYVSIAGPPAERFLYQQTPCSPATVKPFLSVVGAHDDVLRDFNWEAPTWAIDPQLVAGARPAFVDPVVAGERFFFPLRVALRCGEAVRPGDKDAVKDGVMTTWSFCNGSIQMIRVEAAQHSVESLEAAAGKSLLDLVFGFIDEQTVSQPGRRAARPYSVPEWRNW